MLFDIRLGIPTFVLPLYSVENANPPKVIIVIFSVGMRIVKKRYLGSPRQVVNHTTPNTLHS